MPAAVKELAVVRPKASRARYLVVGLMLALIAVAYLDRVCIATAAPAIRKDLGFDEEQMGLVFSAFTLSYALLEMPSGYLADRFGARVSLGRIVVWWSAMTALTGAATGFASLLLVRFLFGMGEAGVFPSMARVYGRWLPSAERGRAFGLAIATGAVAGAGTLKLVAWLLGRISWRLAFVAFGGVGVVWVAVFLLCFRDEPSTHPGVSDAELSLIGEGAPRFEGAAHGAAPWGLLLRSRPLLTLCLMYTAAIYGWYFHLTWLPTYLLQARGFNLRDTGTMSALPLLGIGIGVFLGGWASDRLAARLGPRARRWLATLLAAQASSAVSAAWLLAAAAGLGAAGVAPAWPACIDMAGEHAGVTSGTMNMFGNLGGTLCPIVVGMCVKRLGSWPIALESVAAMYLVAGGMWWIADPAEKIVPPSPTGEA